MVFMKNQFLILFLVIPSILLILSCGSGKKMPDVSVLKKEIVTTEKAFEEAARSKGIAKAFFEFADDSAVILRANDTLVKGKDGILKFYQNPVFRSATVTWRPSFVDVSSDGTLGYTYGNYCWKNRDKSGNYRELRGVFHTVWKKQKDGSWKYVWD
jgi:ketosteroid isomerase-like protein